MTPATLYPPIAAATIVNVSLFALMWRAQQRERREGRPSRGYLVGLLAYLTLVGGFFYLRADAPISGWHDAFGTAAFAEAFGAVIVYAAAHSIWISRDQPMRQRVFPMFLAIVLTVGMFAGLLVKL